MFVTAMNSIKRIIPEGCMICVTIATETNE